MRQQSAVSFTWSLDLSNLRGITVGVGVTWPGGVGIARGYVKGRNFLGKSRDLFGKDRDIFGEIGGTETVAMTTKLVDAGIIYYIYESTHGHYDRRLNTCHYISKRESSRTDMGVEFLSPHANIYENTHAHCERTSNTRHYFSRWETLRTHVGVEFLSSHTNIYESTQAHYDGKILTCILLINKTQSVFI